jgi:hypothetical protein
VDTMISLLVCRRTARGQPAQGQPSQGQPSQDQPSLMIVGNSDALRGLAASFLGLGTGRSFSIGNSNCVITVEPAGEKRLAMITLPTGSFSWHIPVGQARHYADLITAMVKFPGPCHHYLEAAPFLPPVLVSKGEYAAATVQKMRASPA